MAKMEKLILPLDINTTITGNDFKELQAQIKQGLSLNIGGDFSNALQELENEVKVFLEMFDKNSPNFIDQKTTDDFDVVAAKAKVIFDRFKDIQDIAKGIEIVPDTKEVDEKLDQLKKDLKEVYSNVTSSSILKQGDIDILRGTKEHTDASKSRVAKVEFDNLDIKNNEVIQKFDSLLVNSAKSAATLQARINEVNQATQAFNEGASFEDAFSGLFKVGTPVEEVQRMLVQLRLAIRDLTGEEIEFFDLSKGEKTKEVLKDTIDAIDDLEKKEKELKSTKEDIIETAEEQARALETVAKATADGAVAAKGAKVDQDQLNAAQEESDRIRQENSDSIKQLINRYLSFGAILATIKRAATEAFNVLSDLDKAFTEMAVVTNYTNKQIWGFYDAFKGIAEITGFKTAEIASVTAEYLKQGETLQDSLTLTEAAAKAAQVAGIDTADSVRYLTSAVRGYRLEAEDAMLVSDKFAAVAAATATDYDGMATAMSKVAAQAYANGVEMDNLMGLLSTAMDVTQEAPENIGTAFKTIFARMSQITDYGKVLEDGADINKVEKALKLANVPLRDMEGNFRKLDDVLMDVGANWQSLNSTQKAYITNTLAGTRQQTRLLAVFENYDKLLANIETSQESAGATSAQQAKYMEGLAAAQNEVAIAWGNLITSITNTDIFKGTLKVIADLLNSLADAMDSPIGKALIFTSVLTGLAASLKGAGVLLGKFGSFLGIFGKDGNKIINVLQNSKAGFQTLSTVMTTGIKSAGGFKAVMGSLGTGLMSTISIVTAVAAGISLLATVWNFFNKSRDEKIKEINEELTKLDGNLYNISQENKSINNLLEEFEDLNNKTIKSNEELERMAKILQAIKDFDVDGEYAIMNSDGSINYSERDRMLKDMLEEEVEAERDALEERTKLLEQYATNREGIEKDMLDFTKALIYEMVGSDIDAYKDMSDFTRVSLQRGAEKLSVEKIQKKSGEGYNPDTGQFETTYYTTNRSLEEMQAKLKEAQPLIEAYEKIMLNAANLTGSAVNKLLPTGEDLELLKLFIPEIEELERFENSNLLLPQIQELSSLLTIVTDKTGELSDKVKAELTEAFGGGLGSGTEYLLNNMDKLGLGFGEVTNIIREMNNELHAVDLQNVVDGLSNLESVAANIESASSAIASGNWNADGLQEVINLMMEYPQYSEEILHAIETEGELDSAVKEAMINNQKQKVLHSLELQQLQLENELALAQAELEALNLLLTDKAAREQIFATGKVDLENGTATAIINSLSSVNTETAAALSDRIRQYQEASAKIAKMVADAERGIAPGDAGGVSSGYSRITGDVKAPTWDILNNTVGNMPQLPPQKLTSEQDSKFVDLIKAGIEEKNSQISAIQAQLDLNSAMQSKINALSFDDFAKVKPETGGGGGSGGSGGSGSKGKESDASEKAEYYMGVLNKLYVAEQRIKAAELFIDKSNNLLEFARSVEALGESYEGVREGYVSSAKVLEDQYGLYGAMAEQQDHMIEVLQEYQASLIAELNPALLKTFKVINGRIIPVSEEYAKLTAENMELVDEFAKSFNEYADSIDEASNASLEFKTAQNELLAEMRDAVIEWQEVMIEAIKNEEKKYLDSFKRLIDANKKYLNERKKLYEESFKAEDADQELGKIEEQRLTLSEKIAALEGAHDQQSLKRKEEYRKQLKDLNERYTEITLQYNRDAFMQRIDDQIAYQDEVYAKEEEAYNERISDAQWLEERLTQINNEAKLQALMTEYLHHMTLDELIEQGYISHETATKLGLSGLTGAVGTWSEEEKSKLATHFRNNTAAFDAAWGKGTDPSNPGAAGIVDKYMQEIVGYLAKYHPQMEGATSTMRDKIVAGWNAMSTAALNYTNNFDGVTLKAPNYTELSKGLNNIVAEIKKAADNAEKEYQRLKISQDNSKRTTTTTGGGPTNTTSQGQTPPPKPVTTPLVWTSTTNYDGVFRYINNKNSTIKWDKAGMANPRYNSLQAAKDALYPAKKTTTTSTRGGGGGNFIPTKSGFATGGTTERTGFHWLDGQPGKPERILSPGANKEFEALLNDLAVESKLRVESYMNSDGMKDFGMSFIALSEIGEKLYEGSIKNTDELIDAIMHSSSRIEKTLREGDNQQNNLFNKLGVTLNKK